jgi:ABC-type lipoprotein release transport system permease subunit
MLSVAQGHAPYTAIEIKLKPQVSVAQAKLSLQKCLGANFICKDRFDQHETLNKIMHSEKRISVILLVFILLIVSFNLTAGLVMLVLEKQDNIRTMKSFGASNLLIRKIFLAEGMLVCVCGTLIGLLLGYAVCVIQIQYGIIPIGDANTLVISSYPVSLKLMDFVYVAIAALITGYLCSLVPAMKASKVDPGFRL